MASPRRPLSGVRLTYEITMGGTKFRVRMKESIGNWMGYTPVSGQTGTFGASGLPVIPGLGGGNIGKKFLKAPAGYKFQSFKFLVVPGTVIVEPVPGCNSGTTRRREICSFSLGFPKGPKETPITRWRVESWAKNSPKAKAIIGMVTPSGVQHIWKGKIGSGGLPGIPDIGFPGFGGGGLPALPGGLSIPDAIGLAGQLGGLLF